MGKREKQVAKGPPRKLSLVATTNASSPPQDVAGPGRRRSSTIKSTKSSITDALSPQTARSSKGSVTLVDEIWPLDDSLFDLDKLSTAEGLEYASQALLNVIYRAKKKMETSTTVDSTAALISPMSPKLDVMNVSFVVNFGIGWLSGLGSWILPLLLSYDKEINDIFKMATTQCFPETAKEYAASNIPKLLAVLRGFYLRFEQWKREQDGGVDTKFAQYHDILYRTAPVLETLSTLDTSVALAPIKVESPLMTRSSDATLSPKEVDDPFFAKKSKRQPKNHVLSPILDPKPFHDIGVQVPRDHEEIRTLECDILNERETILKEFFQRLLSPTVHQYAQILVLSLANDISPVGPTEVDRSVQPIEIEFGLEPGSLAPQLETPLVLRMMKSMRIAEEEMREFGPWRMLLSGEAIRYLKRICGANDSIFYSIKETMRQLSEGLFSETNQIRIAGEERDVPVYAAETSSSILVVYIIDCISSSASEGSIQVIKIFGMYPHSKIDKLLWTAVSQWLTSRGTDYQQGCLLVRTPGVDKIFPVPQPFIPQAYGEDSTIGLNEGTMLELHRLLTHEKFVQFSHSVLKGILSHEDSTHPFAVSHYEEQIIYHPSSCFVVGRSGTGKTTTMLFKMLGIERATHKLNLGKSRQVFVTQSKFLAERVEEYFHSLLSSYPEIPLSAEELEWRSTRKKLSERDLIELDEEYEIPGTIPRRLSELEDKDFPLFLTFNQLCALIEADLDVMRELTTPHSDGSRHLRSRSSTIMRKKYLNFDDFHSKYWPHLSTKGFSASQVWNEFQGVICGSERSLEFSNGSLSRDAYETISHRKQANFASDRSRLYDLFERYKKLKASRNEFDLADRTHEILRGMQNYDPAIKFDYMYIDEVQDNLLIDARLIRSLCGNPHGLFWAGDTAQQITSTAFRFSTLTGFLHRLEFKDPDVVSQFRRPVRPKRFNLLVNYRSHGGIVNCAHSIVRLLVALWPDSIDALEREKGLVGGSKPVFFCGRGDNLLDFRVLLGSKGSGNIELGAEQCILVRDNAARRRFLEQFGNVGVVMTLYESKGLEFNDVLLYNFFQDSLVGPEWKVILDASRIARDPLRYMGVSSELKFLYVGLTRARNRLWIWDCSSEAEPMISFWKSEGLIEIRSQGEPVPRFGVDSTVEEWKKKGRDLFGRKNYQQAAICFQRANEPLLQKISTAYHYRQEARLIAVGSDERKATFLQAAEYFKISAQGGHSQSQFCWKQAGECFAEAEAYKEASYAFCEALQFTAGAQNSRKAGDFEKAIEIIRNYPVEASISKSIKSVCQAVFLRRNEWRKARQCFETEKAFWSRLDTLGFDKAGALFEFKRYEELGDLQQGRGELLAAAQSYIKAASPTSFGKASEVLLGELWRILPLGTEIDTKRAALGRELLALCHCLRAQPGEWYKEVSMFEHVLNKDYDSLKKLADSFATNNILGKIRSYAHLAEERRDIKTVTPEDMGRLLRHHHTFGYHLRGILRIDDMALVNSSNTQKLMGYKVNHGTIASEVTIYPSSPLIKLAGNDHSRVKDGDCVIPLRSTPKLVRQVLESHFRTTVFRQCRPAERAHAFTNPCGKNFSGNCNDPECQWLHVSSDADAFNRRFRLFLSQILVINDMDFLLGSQSRKTLRSFWIAKLFDVVYPLHLEAGKISDFRAIPGDTVVTHDLFVLRNWIEDGFYSLNPEDTHETLKLFLIASALDHYRAFYYIKRAGIRLGRTHRGHIGPGDIRPVFLDLFNALFSHSREAISCGVEYVHYILSNKINVDVHGLICVLEMIMAQMLAGLHRNLHALLIPESWLFVLGQRKNWPAVEIDVFIRRLLPPFGTLVEDIINGCDHLSLYRRSIAPTGNTYNRRSLIARVFRCMILAGNKVMGNDIRKEIGDRIMFYGWSYSSTGVLPYEYSNATNWDGLWQATIRASSRSGDPLIQLARSGTYLTAYKDIKPRSFSDTESLFYVFSKSPLIRVAQKSKLRVDAPKFVPHRLRKEIDSSVPPQATSQVEGIHTEVSVSMLTTILDESQLTRSYSQKDRAAAVKIATFYLQCRRKFTQRAAETGPLLKWSSKFRDTSKGYEENRRYQMILRGPMPHIMVCLEAYRKHLDSRKMRASEKAELGQHQFLEDILDELDKIEALRTSASEINDRIGPSSEHHKRASIEALCKDITDTISEIKTYCDERDDLRPHLEIAYKGIVQEPKKKTVTKRLKATLKPVLDTSDI